MGTFMTSIKVGISVAVSVLISKLLNLEYPFFVALAVIIPVQDTYISSLKAGKYRALGTIIGAILGVICYFIQPGSAIISGIGVAFIIFLCDLLKWPQSGPIGGIVFMSIMVNLKGKNPIYYSFSRVIDTLIGVCVTLAVHYLLSFKKRKIYKTH